MIKIGREEPVASMDASGKIIWARHNEIQTVNVKSLGNEYEDVSLSPSCAQPRHLISLSTTFIAVMPPSTFCCIHL